MLCYSIYLYEENMANHIKIFFTSIIPHFEPWKTNLIENWNTIVGDLHEHVKLINIQNNMLILGVYDSAWLQEIYILSPILIKTINNYLGNEYITNVRFKNIGYNSQKVLHIKKTHEVKIQNQPRPQLTTQERTILLHIQDKGLRDALERYLMRCKEE